LNNMSKIDDMALFVQIVKTGGLAAAGRKIRLSPASITLRLNALERRYHTRLLNRTTRKISLTDAGSRFFEACLRVVEEVENAEALLRAADENLSGRLRITAPSDFGRQYVAPALSEYVGLYPGVIPQLHLTDNVVDLVEEGYDLAIRYGNLPDSNLVVRHLASNYRVLVASPGYLEKQGRPGHPDDLARHRCLVLERFGEPLDEWRFVFDGRHKSVRVRPALTSNDGAVIRQWTLADGGIAYKSIRDVQGDLDKGRLQTVLDDYVVGFQSSDVLTTGLQFVFPSRRYMPRHVEAFVEFFRTRLS
ncbi:LysR family transcriptional regulator, partial [Thiolapillus sp.]